MPVKKTSEASESRSAGPKTNKAKTAFGEYKKRMASTGAPMGAGGYPSGLGMVPPWPYPPPPGAMPPPPFPQAPPTGVMPQMPGTGKSFFESVGNMLAMGVGLLTVGMQGGQQILEGLIGVGYGAGPHPGYGHHPHHGWDCGCEMGYPYCDCGYPSCCECDCCHPGVHNCC